MTLPKIVPQEDRRAYTVREFCDAFRVSHSHVYVLMQRGDLHTVRVGGRRLIPRDAAEALLAPPTSAPEASPAARPARRKGAAA